MLDNKAWIGDQNKKMDVEKQMNMVLQRHNTRWKCKNLAVDGNTTQSLIKSLHFHKLQKDKQIQPKRFKSVQQYLESDAIDLSTESPIIVLSVGGNDVLGSMYDREQMSTEVVANMKRNEFMKGYEQILDILITECHCEVMIVFCYEPHFRFCDSHNVERKELLKIMEWAMTEIFGIAERYKLPVIDMSRTGNPYDEKHYSVSPIEPNEKMGMFLVDLVLRVLADFEWNAQHRMSKVYYGRMRMEMDLCSSTMISSTETIGKGQKLLYTHFRKRKSNDLP